MRAATLLALLGCAACGAPATTPSGPALTAVIDSLHMGREDPPGVVPGFDIDGLKSDWRDTRACNKPDFLDPDGNPGIDNQLATLMPLIDLAGENALEGLLQGAINEGRLLLIVRAKELGDGALAVEMLRGDDQPLLGTDGRLLSGQTLALSAEPMLGQSEGRGGDGAMEVGPFAVRLPVAVFTELYELDLVDARMRLRPSADGEHFEGMLGGGVTLEQIFSIVRVAGERADADLEGLFGGGIRDSADLARDASGACQQISLGVSFRAVRAHTYDELLEP